MIRRLYETLTGRPWTTTRSAAAEFGPPPGARYADQLAAYTDAELIAYGNQIVARLHTEHHREPSGHRYRRVAQAHPRSPRPRPRPAATSMPAPARRPVVAGGGR